MEEDEAFDLIPIRLFRAQGEVFKAHHLPALLLQRLFWVGDKRLAPAFQPLRIIMTKT